MDKRRASNVAVVVVIAIITVALSRVLWASPADRVAPTDGQLPFFIFLGVLEAVLFGIGIVFAWRGWPLIQRAAGYVPRWLAIAAYASIIWQLISWWPHDNFHMSIEHGDYQALLYIEYCFHFTLYITAVFVATFFFRILKGLGRSEG